MRSDVPHIIALNLDKYDRVEKVDCGLQHSCMLTADGLVYACGQNEYGQLGIGHAASNEYRPLRVKFDKMSKEERVSKVACGAHHTAFLTD